MSGDNTYKTVKFNIKRKNIIVFLLQKMNILTNRNKTDIDR